MFIPDIVFNNNSYNNSSVKKSNPNKKQISFAANITKEIKLTPEELKKVSVISEIYDRIFSFIERFNWSYKTQFKDLYTNLASGEKIKGLVFKSIPDIGNKRVQVVRFNYQKDTNPELLTFSIMDSKNKNLLRYRVNQKGDVLISSDTNNLSELSKNPFDKNEHINYSDYLDSLSTEMKNLESYTKNYKDAKRTLTKIDRNNNTVREIINNVSEVVSSKGISYESSALMKTYEELCKELNAKQGKDALALKQAYFGDSLTAKTKGLIFKNQGENKETYHFCPLESKDDDRIFKIVIFDKNENLTNSFVFFADGKVSKQRTPGTETNHFRPNNLIQISDNEIETLGIKNIFKLLNDKFMDFKTFIINKRNEKSSKRIEKIELKKQEEIKLKTEQTAKKSAKQQQKHELEEQKLREKELKARLREQKQQEKLQKKLQQEELKLARQKAAEAKKLVKETKIQESKKQILEQKEITPEIPKETTDINKSKFNNKNYSEIRLFQIKEELEQLFATPVEERSSHLIHEKLSNGKIFAGRVSMKASDGADITISRIKSPKYVEFTYYSIRIKKDGKEMIMNIDPELDRIIKSRPDGKIIIDDEARVKYISKEKFLADNPDAVKLPQYLTEIFDVKTGGEAKVIQSSLKIKKQKDLLKEKEKDILDALNQKMDDFFD